MTAPAAEIDRLKTFYNADSKTDANPGGMGNDGHRTNLIPALQDVGVVGQYVAEVGQAVEQAELDAAAVSQIAAEAADSAALASQKAGEAADSAQAAAGSVDTVVQKAGEAADSAGAAAGSAATATQMAGAAAASEQTATQAAGTATDAAGVASQAANTCAQEADAAAAAALVATEKAAEAVAAANKFTRVFTPAGAADGETNDLQAIRDVMVQAKGAPGSAVFLRPGVWAVPRWSVIHVPRHTTVYGIPGQSIVKACLAGDPEPADPVWPVVGNGLFVAGDPETGERYLTETGRVASGTGAAFNVTVTDGAVTAATVAAGGTGYKVGDSVDLANGTKLTVAAVASYKGALTQVTVAAGGAGWGVPANPVEQLSSAGMKHWDRILDPDTIGGPICIRGLVLDGDWGPGNPRLVNSTYRGIYLIGLSEAVVENCVVRNFPNDGISLFDCKRGKAVDNTVEYCGWTGGAGTARNAISNAGIYVTTNASELNTDRWEISRNHLTCIGDVPIEYHWITGVIRDNTILDYGSIAIEGQGAPSDFDCSLEHAGNNGGVEIPADVVVEGNKIDGARRYSAAWDDVSVPEGSTQSDLPHAVDGLSLVAGNQGHIQVRNNVVKNTLRRALYIEQSRDGRVDVLGNEFYYVGRGHAAVTPNAIFLFKTDQLRFGHNKVQGYIGAAGQPILNGIMTLEGQGTVVDISDNAFDTIGFGGLLYATYYGATPVKMFRFARNTISNMWGGAILAWYQTNAANKPHVQLLEISGNAVLNVANNAGNPNYATESPFRLYSTGTADGTIDVDVLKFEDNSYQTNMALHLDAKTPILYFDAASDAPIGFASIRRNVAPGFTLFAFGPNTRAPATLAVEANTAAANHIGIPGAMGFGVGTYPGELPWGFHEMEGTRSPAHANYGNYRYADGSVMVWVPAFYYKVNTDNTVEIAAEGAFSDEAAANAAGFALHRAFKDGGATRRGFFVDKYQCSNNGGTASSLRNGIRSPPTRPTTRFRGSRGRRRTPWPACSTPPRPGARCSRAVRGSSIRPWRSSAWRTARPRRPLRIAPGMTEPARRASPRATTTTRSATSTTGRSPTSRTATGTAEKPAAARRSRRPPTTARPVGSPTSTATCGRCPSAWCGRAPPTTRRSTTRSAPRSSTC